MNDVTRIRVGKNQIGIIGLKEALAEAKDNYSGMSDDQIGNLLLEKLSKKNYIVSGQNDTYKQAFLREYKKHIGEPVTEEPRDGLQIKILSPGCLRCERMERDVMSVMSENGIMAELENVRDLDEIGSYGVMGTPALLVNGEVKAVGMVPSKSKIKAWLEKAAGQR